MPLKKYHLIHVFRDKILNSWKDSQHKGRKFRPVRKTIQRNSKTKYFQDKFVIYSGTITRKLQENIDVCLQDVASQKTIFEKR